ncbi:hypothetical protein [Fusobacterium pseudoperiodonticum]
MKNIMETYKQKIDFYMFAPNKNHYILFIKLIENRCSRFRK